jgi:hypothetical protein
MGLSIISSNTTMKNLKRSSGAISTGIGTFSNILLMTAGAGEYIEISHIMNGAVVVFAGTVTFSVIDSDSGKILYQLGGTLNSGSVHYSRMTEEMQGGSTIPRLFNMPPNSQLKMSGLAPTAQTVTVTGRAIINTP